MAPEYMMTAVEQIPMRRRSRWLEVVEALGTLPAGSIRRIETETSRDAKTLALYLRRFSGVKAQMRTEDGKLILYVTVLGPVERRTTDPQRGGEHAET